MKLTSPDLDYRYVLALLNSALLSFYKTKSSGAAKKDDFTQITLEDLRQLPIPPLSVEEQRPFIHLAGLVLEAKKDNQETTDYEHQIDQLVYQLYGLNAEDIAFIEEQSK